MPASVRQVGLEAGPAESANPGRDRPHNTPGVPATNGVRPGLHMRHWPHEAAHLPCVVGQFVIERQQRR